MFVHKQNKVVPLNQFDAIEGGVLIDEHEKVN